jgi:uncharacterized membrane protein
MLKRLKTFFKHRWLDESDTGRVIGLQTLERLARLVAASEEQHSGEIRIFVEASLPTTYLWRHLVHKVPMAALARQRALMMFSKLGVWDTADNNGVLIYLLLAERKIELVADRGVNAVVGRSEWDAMVKRMAAAFAAGRFEAGLAQAVDEVSAPLLRHFAVQPGADNRNELPDAPSLG